MIEKVIVLFVCCLLGANAQNITDPDCPPNGISEYQPVPDNCVQFFQCVDGQKRIFECPSGLHFNPTSLLCDWPDQAGCEYLNSTTTEPSWNTTITTPNWNTTEPNWNVTDPDCPANGTTEYKPVPDNCAQFFQCVDGQKRIFECPSGLHFNPTLLLCDWPEQAGCENLNSTTTEPSWNTTITTPNWNTTEPNWNVTDPDCPANGTTDYQPVPDNCAQFFQCVDGQKRIFECPSGLHFNPTLLLCDWPEQAGCQNLNSTTTEPTWNTTTPSWNTTWTPNWNTTTPSWNTTETPNWNTTTPSWNTTEIPNWNTTTPSWNTTETPNWNTTTPSWNTTGTPNWNTTTPSWNTTETPTWNTTSPSWNTTETPNWNTTIPSWNATETPNWNTTTPSWNATTPSWNSTTPNWNGTKSDKESKETNETDGIFKRMFRMFGF